MGSVRGGVGVTGGDQGEEGRSGGRKKQQGVVGKGRDGLGSTRTTLEVVRRVRW